MSLHADEKRGIALNPLSQTHYIDHLAAVCAIMDMPLLFIDETDFALGKRLYPSINCQLQEYHQFNPEYLIANYDVLFMSDLWGRRAFHAKYQPLEEKYGKTLRHVHCPHGFSDKGFYLKKCAQEDIALLYGQNMVDLLQLNDSLDELPYHVICGNYRRSFYQQHRPFYDELMAKDILARFAKKQTTILYAPTWMDMEESTSFFEAYKYLLDNLPADYNMIVKLHPRLELDDTAMYYYIVGKYQDQPNVVFLKDYPLVYPILALCDIYIGDMASVGYDFLSFDKPMFFLNKQRRNPKIDRGLYLFRCGVEVKPDAYPLIYRIIDKHLPDDHARFSEIRKATYHYTFGEERPFDAIKKDIIRAYNSTYVP